LKDQDPRPSSAGASDHARRRRSVALDVERLGLIGLRSPAASVVIAVVLAIAAIFGVAKLTIDDSLSELFRIDTPDFRLFEQVSRQFPSAEYDVLVVVKGKSLLSRDSIEKLRTMVADLQLIDGARGVISVFSVREPSTTGGIPAPLFPGALPQGADYEKLVKRVKSNELIRDRLLSDDGRLPRRRQQLRGRRRSRCSEVLARGDTASARPPHRPYRQWAIRRDRHWPDIHRPIVAQSHRRQADRGHQAPRRQRL
jgi:hypothetical protein